MFARQRLVFIISALLLVGSANAQDPDLVAWWKLDETAGTMASDSSGNGNDGIVNGGAKWVAGVVDGALEFDGVDDYVGTTGIEQLVNWTATCWVISPQAPMAGDPSGPLNRQGNVQFNWNHSNPIFQGTAAVNAAGVWYGAKFTPLEANTWYHLAATYDGSALKAYRDGVLITSTPASGTPATASQELQLATAGARGNRYFAGTLDEVRLYRRALTEQEILQVMAGAPAVLATDPSPADGATDVPRDVVLGWTPSEFAARHDVYFGTSLDDVNNATVSADPSGAYAGRQDETAYDPDGLEFGRTYCWRVDEVNAPPDSTVFKGNVWRFTTETFANPIAGGNITATASSSNSADEGAAKTIDGSGLGADDLHSADNANMWLSSITGAQPTWIRYEFDRVYKLHQMVVWNHNSLLEQAFGLGIKNATIEYSVDGADWITLGAGHEFARASGAAGYPANTTIDLGGVAAKYVRITANSNWGGIVTQYGLSEVRFLAIPVQAREPNPASGSTDMEVDNVTLAWRAGREAAAHDVYLSTDEQAVIDETVSPVSVPAGSSYAAYDTGPLDLNRTYYWKINEINPPEADQSRAVWQGDVWNFTTQESLVVDDFEAYNDLNPDDPESNRIFLTWMDGFENPANGSQVGHTDLPFAETTIVHGGSQSMPFYYDNSAAGLSEATADAANLAIDRNWTTNGAEVLTLWFRGLPPLFGSFVEGPPVTMTARGAGIAGASDQFHFAHQPLSGDGSITVRVVSLTNTNAGARAGIMIRETLDANAMHAAVAVTPDSGVVLLSRSSEGGNSTTVTAEAGVTAPQWLRLTRAGRNFTAEYSSNGTTWTAIGEPQSIAMSSNALVGLCLTAGTAGATCTAEFSNVTASGTTPGAWRSQDIGIASNAAEQLYVILNDNANNSALVAHPDPAASTIDTWTEWEIPLADFAGVNAQTVASVTIGVGDSAAGAPGQAGGSGLMYFDDIGLRPSREAPQDPDLVMYYALDGNPTDSSGNGFHGAIQGDPQWVDGIIGGALEFNGDDYVGTSNTEQLINWTVALWVTSPEAPKSGPYGGLVNRQGNYQVNWDHTNEFLGVAAVNAGGFKPASFGPVEADTWYHIAATYDGNTLKAYRDGVLITATQAPGVPANANREMRFGMGSFVGTLDEVRVYRRALTDAEITDLGGFVEPDLAGHYKLDGDAADASGNGYDGAVQGDPRWVEGLIDGALEFNGEDYVGTGNTEQLANWTVACWVTSPAAPKTGPYGGLINRQGNYQLNWDHPNETFQGVAAVNVGGFQGAGFGPVEADTWYHIAATYDGNTLKAYRDGVLITAVDLPGVPANANREMRFGMGSFAGTLDDVRLYREALSDAQIAKLANIAGGM